MRTISSQDCVYKYLEVFIQPLRPILTALKMFTSIIITTSTVFLSLLGSTTAVTVQQANAFTFKTTVQHAVCPAAAGSKANVSGQNFGILCGWNALANDHISGPVNLKTFELCLTACAKNSKCGAVTFSPGACYLKSAQPTRKFGKTSKAGHMAAIKLMAGGNGGGATRTKTVTIDC